mgnify:CR=1 FL=1
MIRTRVLNIAAVLLCLHAIFYTVGLYNYFNFYMSGTVYRASFFGFLLIVLYLAKEREDERTGQIKKKAAGWADYFFLLIGIVPVGYYVFFNHRLLDEFTKGSASTLSIVMFLLLVASIFEGARRLIGWVMPILAALFILQFTYGSYFPGILNQANFGLKYTVSKLFTGTQGIWGMPLDVASTVVMVFIIFSQMLIITGGGKFFIDLAIALMGRFRGGPAQSAVLASAFFGSLSGSPTANVVGTGVITIPLMKKIGYRPEFAGGIEAVASNGGQIMPPVMGSVIFLMADFTGIGYAAIVVAAILPALLYYIAAAAQIDLEAAKQKLKAVDPAEIPKLSAVLKDGWHFFIPFIALVVMMVYFQMSPSMSAIISMVILFLVTLHRKEQRITPRKLYQVLAESGKMMPIVGVSVAVAGITIACISSAGLGFKISSLLVDLSGGSFLFLLLLAALASFIMGLGLSVTPAYIMLAILVAPTMVQFGATELSAHLFAVYWGIASFITPPVAMASFVAAGIAKADPMKTAMVSMRLGIATYVVPFIFIYHPDLLLGQGNNASGMLYFLFACFAVYAFAVASVGYLFRHVALWERAVWGVISILLIIPEIISSVVGLAAFAAMMFYMYKTRKSSISVEDETAVAGSLKTGG